MQSSCTRSSTGSLCGRYFKATEQARYFFYLQPRLKLSSSTLEAPSLLFAPTHTCPSVHPFPSQPLGEVYHPRKPTHHFPAPTSIQCQIHRCYFAPTNTTITVPYLPVEATNQPLSDDPRPPPPLLPKGPPSARGRSSARRVGVNYQW